MAIKISEISALIKEQIKKYSQDLETKSIGKVIKVGDGIALIYGLDDAMYGELLDFSETNGKYMSVGDLFDIRNGLSKEKSAFGKFRRQIRGLLCKRILYRRRNDNACGRAYPHRLHTPSKLHRTYQHSLYNEVWQQENTFCSL